MKMPVHCPACQARLRATRLRCGRCGTAVEGDFDLGLGALGREDGRFARAFLLARGNLRELERSLGLSYAALRGRLDALVTHLEGQLGSTLGEAGGEAGHGGVPVGRPGGDVVAVLDRLEAGEIDAQTAARLLRGAGPEDGDEG